jgi:hypothetical protein
VGEGRTDEPAPNPRRVPVAEAAKALGISEGAVRMRVKRLTLPSTREGGRLYVLLDTEPTPDPERTHDRTSELIAALREQLQAERQAHAEARRLLMAALERIPAIEAPTGSPSPGSDAPGPPSGGEDTPGRGETPGTPETPAQRPSWWRRMFVVFLVLVVGRTAIEMPPASSGGTFAYRLGSGMAIPLMLSVFLAALLLLIGGVYYVTARKDGATFGDAFFNWPMVILAGIVAVLALLG